MVELVSVDQWRVEKCWANWLEFHYGLDCEEVMDRFCRCIDPGNTNKDSIDPWGNDNDIEAIEVFPDIATRLNILSGPHYATFIKAYYVNHPWRHND